MWRKRATSIKQHIADYCEDSTLAGVKYVVAKDRPLSERTWWMVAITCSFLWSMYLIHEVWNKWNNSPVIISFAEETTPVWRIPFPAITICSRSKARQSIFNITKIIGPGVTNASSYDEYEKYMILYRLCSHQPELDNFLLRDMPGRLFMNESMIDFLEEVAALQEKFFSYCMWQTAMIECAQLFTPIMTEEGYCFTTNSLSHSELYHKDGLNSKYLRSLPNATYWDLDKGYYNDTGPLHKSYPHRAISSGTRFGLRIVINEDNKDWAKICMRYSSGFTVTMHNPAEVASVSNRFFNVPPDHEVFLAVKPNMMTTSSDLRSYSPQRRQCFFADERKLAFYKVYTQKNCEFECQTNYTLEVCGCAMFDMPRTKDTPICGLRSYECAYNFFREKITDEIRRTTTWGDNVDLSSTCNCLQSCTSIEYDAEASHIPNSSPSADTAILRSGLVIYFKDPQFIARERRELYGLSEFIANCGGLLGLTNGFCILSLVEIIYYFTLRLYHNYYPEDEEKRTDTDEIEKEESKSE